MAVQFSGETPWEAIVHHESLDIEEESELAAFCATQGVDPQTATLAELEALHLAWKLMT